MNDMNNEGRAFVVPAECTTGNLRVQGAPLSLQGEGVLIGLVDTGD